MAVSRAPFKGHCAICGREADAEKREETAVAERTTPRKGLKPAKTDIVIMSTLVIRCIAGDEYVALDYDTEVQDPFAPEEEI